MWRVVLVIIGALVALYVGLYLMFIGGIIDIIHAVKTDVSEWSIAIGIVKIIFSLVIGWLCFLIPVSIASVD